VPFCLSQKGADQLTRETSYKRFVVVAAPHPCPSLRLHQSADVSPAVDVAALVPLGGLVADCGDGVGLAVCPALGLLVTSSNATNTLSVFNWSLPAMGAPSVSPISAAVPAITASTSSDSCRPAPYPPGATTGFALVCTIGAPQALFRFGSEFSGVGRSGYLAFLGPAEDHRLLVTDAGNDAVHVVDVAGQRHVGYLAAPEAIRWPRGVAARGSRVVVSTWKALRWTERAQFDGQVCLFEGSGTSWVQLWTVLGPGGPIPGSPGGWLRQPNGLRFSADGGEVVVADSAMDRVVVYSADDGRFVRQLGPDLPSPVDVQECACSTPVHRYTHECCGGVHTDMCLLRIHVLLLTSCPPPDPRPK
jgi:DNA-binding beta-propeller fold protein YncE